MILKTLVLPISLLLFLSSAMSENVVDFCVADLSLPKGPAGYPCKNPANLTVDDFVFSGFAAPGGSKINFNLFNLNVTFAMDSTYTALNGLGLSMARLDIGVGGVVPVHTHRVSELIIVIEGTIIAGFIGSDDTPYYKTLNKGDIMIFPHTLLHFQVNTGSTPAVAIVSLNSPNPGFQFISTSLFGNGLPTEVVDKITLLDVQEVKKLKAVFGGTN